ncbi:MAG: cupin domain-containing protein [Chloroflexi bacterium]|nr:cupin domain-containing protein [Chloroflexota bacterium]
MKAFDLASLLESRAGSADAYLEFIREASMSVGLYVLAAGAVDGQSPHGEDEIYVVMAGRSQFTAGGQTRDIAPGDVLFVAAEAPHRFHDIEEELVLIVIFAPPEGATLRELEAAYPAVARMAAHTD